MSFVLYTLSKKRLAIIFTILLTFLILNKYGINILIYFINSYFSMIETLSKNTSTKQFVTGPQDDFICNVIPPLTSGPVTSV